jgi:hypothetical protein
MQQLKDFSSLIPNSDYLYNSQNYYNSQSHNDYGFHNDYETHNNLYNQYQPTPKCAPACPPTPKCAPACPPTPKCAPACPPTPKCAPACPPTECNIKTMGEKPYEWSWLGALILWFIIFTVLFWLIFYSLKPNFVLQTNSTIVDTSKVLLSAIISALILVIIIWLIKTAVSRKYKKC